MPLWGALLLLISASARGAIYVAPVHLGASDPWVMGKDADGRLVAYWALFANNSVSGTPLNFARSASYSLSEADARSLCAQTLECRGYSVTSLSPLEVALYLGTGGHTTPSATEVHFKAPGSASIAFTFNPIGNADDEVLRTIRMGLVHAQDARVQLGAIRMAPLGPLPLGAYEVTAKLTEPVTLSVTVTTTDTAPPFPVLDAPVLDPNPRLGSRSYGPNIMELCLAVVLLIPLGWTVYENRHEILLALRRLRKRP